MKFEFVEKVNTALFDATAAAWRQQIAADPANNSFSFYEARLLHFQGALNGSTFGNDGKGSLCAVVEEGSDHAAALIVVSYVKDRHLKMLDVTVCPDLNAADREPNFPELAWIAAVAIIGCLRLTYRTYQCDELKVLAHWPLDKDFLTAITTAMVGDPQFGSMFSVAQHGSWIVLMKRKGEGT